MIYTAIAFLLFAALQQFFGLSVINSAWVTGVITFFLAVVMGERPWVK